MRPTINCTTDANTRHWINRIRYVFDFLETHPCSDGVRWLINAADTPLDTIHIHYGTEISSPQSAYIVRPNPLLMGVSPDRKPTFFSKTWNFGTKHVYSVETSQGVGNGAFINAHNFNFDWVSTIFFHLSRVEEYAPARTDDIGIMPSSDLLLPKYGLQYQPVVDRLVVSVLEALGLAVKNTPTTFSITHDLDSLTIFGASFLLPRYLIGTAVRHRKIAFWPRLIRDYLASRSNRQKDPGDTLDWLLSVPHRHSKKIYFGTGTTLPQDEFPKLLLPRMGEIKILTAEQGYEFGLHPGFGTWKNEDLMRSEKSKLEDWLDMPIRHSRQHYLRFSFPDTANILEAAGLTTDSSLGYRSDFGFRCGTGFPFHLYHFGEERPYCWTEIPLILMDIGILRSAQFNKERIQQACNDFFKANALNTHICLNFHNTIFYEQDLADLSFQEMYLNLVQNF